MNTKILSIFLLAAYALSSTVHYCPSARPEVCTQNFDPVCARDGDGGKSTYSNWCVACSKSYVFSYTNGYCNTSSGSNVISRRNLNVIRIDNNYDYYPRVNRIYDDYDYGKVNQVGKDYLDDGLYNDDYTDQVDGKYTDQVGKDYVEGDYTDQVDQIKGKDYLDDGYVNEDDYIDQVDQIKGKY
jgi:hypothetical protein